MAEVLISLAVVAVVVLLPLVPAILLFDNFCSLARSSLQALGHEKAGDQRSLSHPQLLGTFVE